MDHHRPKRQMSFLFLFFFPVQRCSGSILNRDDSWTHYRPMLCKYTFSPCIDFNCGQFSLNSNWKELVFVLIWYFLCFWILHQGEQCVWHQPCPLLVCHRNIWSKCCVCLCKWLSALWAQYASAQPTDTNVYCILQAVFWFTMQVFAETVEGATF